MFTTFLFGTLIIPRTHRIIMQVRTRHNKDIMQTPELVRFVMGMVWVSGMNDEEIIKEVLKMDEIKKKELAS